eukprot:scaffold783_cov324-Ochromonas_danica.AAC.1
MLLNAVPEAILFSPVHREGQIVLSDSSVINLNRVLFDTGAIHANYISSKLVQKHSNLLYSKLQPCKSAVKLADNATTVVIQNSISLAVSFMDDDGHEHVATISFFVFPTDGNDMIIGLPAILSSFSKLFLLMMKAAIDDAVGGEDKNKDLSSITTSSSLLHLLQSTSSTSTSSTSVPSNDATAHGLTRSPWSNPLLEEAPENVETPLPVNFANALHFMEMSYDEAVKEFVDLIQTHVSQDFAKATPIVELLKTKGLLAFVPQNWKGINGLELLELTWLEGLPSSMKPKARPINPKLYANARKEFDRLSKYFYKPSSSPIASCLVIAPKATAPFLRFCGDYVQINKYISTGHFPIPHVMRSLEKITQFAVFLDFDLANAFHQIRLAPTTSSRLSVQTPWGQVEPTVMPEGIGPASGILQS